MTEEPSEQHVRRLLECGVISRQTVGIDKLESLIETNPETACQLAPTLLELCDEDPFLRKRVLSASEAMAKQVPKEFATQEGVLDQLVSVVEADPTNGGLKAVRVLDYIAEETPEIVSARIPASALSNVIEHGDSNDRKAAYRLAGAVSTPESLALLTAINEYEHADLRDVADDALQQAGQRIVEQIANNSDSLDHQTIARIEVITREHPDIFIPKSDVITRALLTTTSADIAAILTRIGKSNENAAAAAVDRLIGSFTEDHNQDVARIIGQTTGKVASFHETVSEDFVEQFEHTLDQQGSQLSSLWYRALVPQAEAFPAKLSEHIDIFSETAENDNATELSRVSALETIKNITAAGETNGSTILKSLLSCAKDTNKAIVIAAINAMGELTLNPIPPELSAASKSSDPEIRQAADRAINRARIRSKKHTLPAIPSNGSAVNFLSENDDLKFFTPDGIWTTPVIPGIQRSLFKRVANAHRADRGGPILLPWHDPACIIPIALELALQNVATDGSVVIYSPFHRGDGTFGDLLQQYRNYGLNPTGSTVTAATRFEEIIGISRINEQSGEIDTYTSGTASCRVILVKDHDDLEQIPNPIAIVANGIGWAKQEVQSLNEMIEDRVEAPIYNVYSRVSRDDQESGFNRYWIPQHIDSEQAIEPTAESAAEPEGQPQVEISSDSNGGTSSQNPFRNAYARQAKASDEAVLQIKQVGQDDVLDHLSEAHEIVAELDEVRTQALYQTLRGAVYWIQDMVAPLEAHDHWARTQTSLHGRYQPSTTDDMLTEIDREVDNFSSIPFVEGAGFDLKQELTALFELLAETTPKFETLCNKIRATIDSDYTAGVVFLKASRRQPAVRAVCDELDMEVPQLEREGVHIVGPDEIRTITDLDITIFPNSLPRSMAGLYLLNNTTGSQIFTYESGREGHIRRDCEWYLEAIDSRLTGSIENLCPQPVIEAIGSDTEHPQVVETDEDSQSERSKLLAAVESNLSGRGRSGAGNEISRIVVTTDTGEKITYNSTDRVLVSNSEVDGEAYEWLRIAELSPGNTFLFIDPELRSRLLSSLLEKSYEEEIGGEFDLYEILADWWENIQVIEAQADSIAEVHSRLQRAGLDRNYSTVRNWIRSAQEADGPLDLVEDSDLVIGPEETEDIRIIGEVFGITEFRDQAPVIGSVMAACRGFNRTKGKEVSGLIKSAVSDDTATVWDFIEEKQVSQIEPQSE